MPHKTMLLSKLAFCALDQTLYIASDHNSQTFEFDKLDACLHSHLKEFLRDITPTEIITTAGPGPFTSLRIQIAAAQGLAFGYNVPLKMIKTFDLFEQDGLILLNTKTKDYFGRFIADGVILREGMFTEDEIGDPSRALRMTSGDVNLAEKLLAYKGPFETAPYYLQTPNYKKATTVC